MLAPAAVDAAARRSGDLVALHRMQVVLTQRLIMPAMVVVLLAGLYLSFQEPYSLADEWIGLALVILIALFALAGSVFAPTERRCLELAERDASAGTPCAEYRRAARRIAVAGSVWYVLVIAAIVLMVFKPGA